MTDLPITTRRPEPSPGPERRKVPHLLEQAPGTVSRRRFGRSDVVRTIGSLAAAAGLTIAAVADTVPEKEFHRADQH